MIRVFSECSGSLSAHWEFRESINRFWFTSGVAADGFSLQVPYDKNLSTTLQVVVRHSLTRVYTKIIPPSERCEGKVHVPDAIMC